MNVENQLILIVITSRAEYYLLQVTTGGSESLLIAVLAARNKAHEKGIRYPELVIPITAHAAFDKACNYFRVKAIHVPVDNTNYKLNLSAMKRAISKNTCLVSAVPRRYLKSMDKMRLAHEIEKKNSAI